MVPTFLRIGRIFGDIPLVQPLNYAPRESCTHEERRLRVQVLPLRESRPAIHQTGGVVSLLSIQEMT
ncbi:hypothetical protein CY652_16455 [Burkholderia sp. WAC0059]|uniref:hypothetical protein n=1 Tax=Burkholderia sp. WAC0059 TaxID=2066022 RepID=UPI000C7E91ED|nr:hypothetical protein [Burkholderia sp. WAC0059]PLZ01418.1 hypothetical protein CY652_16455 [Burkholderia sp. WAC0059]